MSKSKTYTQTEVDNVKKMLGELPDLSKDKIPTADALHALRDQIVDLANSKGYTAAEIRVALEGVGMSVTVKAIEEIINTKKRRQRAKAPEKAQ